MFCKMKSTNLPRLGLPPFQREFDLIHRADYQVGLKSIMVQRILIGYP